MERFDIDLRDGRASFSCCRCGYEVDIDSDLPFMPQLQAHTRHVCDIDLLDSAAPFLRLVSGTAEESRTD